MDDVRVKLQNGKRGRPSLRAVLSFVSSILVIGGFMLASLFLPKPEVLTSERRLPAVLPQLSAQNLLDARFQESFEGWAADNFPARESLRTLRALIVFDVLGMTDKEGLYTGTAGAGKLDPVNQRSMGIVAGKLERIVDDLEGRDLGLNFYYAIIPDKSLYDERGLPGFNPSSAASALNGRLPGVAPIDLSDALTARDFYRSDLHWDQTRIAAGLIGEAAGTKKTADIPDVVATLGAAMGFSDRIAAYGDSLEVGDAGSFAGVYAGQLALPLEPDRLRYLRSPITDAFTVEYLDPTGTSFVPGPVYDLEAAKGRDPYDLFLRGVQPLVRIQNPAAPTTQELYLFRDSFGSSLAPLLALGYSRVTLIDLRYIDYRTLDEYLSFTPGSDVLFCYSSQTFNSSSILLAP